MSSGCMSCSAFGLEFSEAWDGFKRRLTKTLTLVPTARDQCVAPHACYLAPRASNISSGAGRQHATLEQWRSSTIRPLVEHCSSHHLLNRADLTGFAAAAATMTALKQVERSATVAFCPHANLLAVVGAIDMNFSTSPSLQCSCGCCAQAEKKQIALLEHACSCFHDLWRGLCLLRTSAAAHGVSAGARTLQQACMRPARRRTLPARTNALHMHALTPLDHVALQHGNTGGWPGGWVSRAVALLTQRPG